MARTKFSGEIAKEILLGLAVLTAAAGFTLLLAAAPGLGKVLKGIADMYNNSNSKRKYLIRKSFKALRRARLIEEKDLPDGSTTIVLSEAGRRWILKYKLDDLKIESPKKWDRKGRFVIFDFPKRYVRERELFRNKLKLMGFYQVNRSVWVHAFPCRDEIDFISEYLKVSSHVRLIEATSFDGSEDVKSFFNI